MYSSFSMLVWLPWDQHCCTIIQLKLLPLPPAPVTGGWLDGEPQPAASPVLEQHLCGQVHTQPATDNLHTQPAHTTCHFNPAPSTLYCTPASPFWTPIRLHPLYPYTHVPLRFQLNPCTTTPLYPYTPSPRVRVDHSGTYECRPSNSQPAGIQLNVLEGENEQLKDNLQISTIQGYLLYFENTLNFWDFRLFSINLAMKA